MLFEHNKVKIVNLIEPKFHKTKRTWNKDMFSMEANLMETKRGGTKKFVKIIFNIRKWRRWFMKRGSKRIKMIGYINFSISTRQRRYYVIKYLNIKKANIIVGRLVAMIPTTRWDLGWWFTTHHIKLQEKEVYLVEVEFESCAQLVEMVCKGMPSKGVLVDEGKQMNVMTIFTMETLGLWCDCHSKCSLRIDNKIKLENFITIINISILGIIITLDSKSFGVKLKML